MVVPLILLAGFAGRCVVTFNVNVFHPYEMFQELEQGHRLAFGSGVVPFEFLYGYRSWLVPGLVATVMKVSSWLSSDPRTYLYALRFTAILFSLSVVVVGYLIADRAIGRGWAILTALLCALWYQAVFFSPFLMPEIFAAYAALFAVYLAESRDLDGDLRRTFAIGALLALAFCLRFQMAPALLLIASWYSRTHWRRRWAPLLLAAVCVMLPVVGVLDFVTLGSPFQSIWLNFHMNVNKGVATDFGKQPASFYLEHLSASRWLAVTALLGWVAMLGAYRAPLLAASMAVIVVSHSFFAHKEQRFICFALMAIPILMGLGLSVIAELIQRRADRGTAVASTAALVVLILAASFSGIRSMTFERGSNNGGVFRAFLAAHDEKGVCGIAVADFTWFITGGYTYFHRDAPAYFTHQLTPTSRAGYYGTLQHPQLALATRFVLDGRTVPQFAEDRLADKAAAYNVLIASDRRFLPGFRQVQCFPNGPAPIPQACLYRRMGGCTREN